MEKIFPDILYVKIFLNLVRLIIDCVDCINLLLFHYTFYEKKQFSMCILYMYILIFMNVYFNLSIYMT